MKIRTRTDRGTGKRNSKRKSFQMEVAKNGNFRAYFAAHNSQEETEDEEGETKKVWVPTGQLVMRLEILGGFPVAIGWNHEGRGPLATIAASLPADCVGDFAATVRAAQTAWDDDNAYAEAVAALDAFIVANTPKPEPEPQQSAPAQSAGQTTNTPPAQTQQPAAPKPRGGLTGLVGKK